MILHRFCESGIGSGVSHRTGIVWSGVLYGQLSATEARAAADVEHSDTGLARVRCVLAVLFNLQFKLPPELNEPIMNQVY